MVRQKPAKLPFPSSILGATSNLPIASSVLYLVSTPIGNLADFSFRAVETLKKCDYILCEDTRHSRFLLEHYGIQTPLKSFHKFNEAKALEQILSDLKEGKTLALISDAGTPLISDPGQELVLQCRAEGIAVSAIPGGLRRHRCPRTFWTALYSIPIHRIFAKKEKELHSTLSQALFYAGTTIAYQSPHRIEETLAAVAEIDPLRKICVAQIATVPKGPLRLVEDGKLQARSQYRSEKLWPRDKFGHTGRRA